VVPRAAGGGAPVAGRGLRRTGRAA
jgi:hypothetical protein